MLQDYRGTCGKIKNKCGIVAELLRDECQMCRRREGVDTIGNHRRSGAGEDITLGDKCRAGPIKESRGDH